MFCFLDVQQVSEHWIVKAKKILKKIIKESAFCQKIANICDVNPHAMQYYGQNGEDIFVTN